MLIEPVFGNDLPHIGAYFSGGGDRCAGPRLEAVAEGVKITIGADAGIAVSQPGAAKTLLRFEDDESCARNLRLQVIGAADSGNAGTDDEPCSFLTRNARW